MTLAEMVAALEADCAAMRTENDDLRKMVRIACDEDGMLSKLRKERDDLLAEREAMATAARKSFKDLDDVERLAWLAAAFGCTLPEAVAFAMEKERDTLRAEVERLRILLNNAEAAFGDYPPRDKTGRVVAVGDEMEWKSGEWHVIGHVRKGLDGWRCGVVDCSCILASVLTRAAPPLLTEEEAMVLKDGGVDRWIAKGFGMRERLETKGLVYRTTGRNTDGKEHGAW